MVVFLAVERNGDVLAPKGGTEIRVDDVVTVFSKRGFAPDVMGTFSETATR